MRTTTPQRCTIEGCGRPLYGQGYCQPHHSRWRRLGDPQADKPIRARRSKNPSTCIVDDCEFAAHAEGRCATHHRRWSLHGRLDPKSAEQRFWEQVDQTAGDDACWLWLGAVASGYGQFAITTSVRTGAHRYAYELTSGPIADGLHIDHTCRIRLCVNPAHLQAVTPEENNRRRRLTAADHARLRAAS